MDYYQDEEEDPVFLDIFKHIKIDEDAILRPSKPIRVYDPITELCDGTSIKEYLLNDYKFLNQLRTIAYATGKPMNNEDQELRAILDECVHEKNPKVVKVLGLFLIKMLRRAIKSFKVTYRKLMEVRRSSGDCPFILLPTHRSYADFILMAFIYHAFDMEVPCVAAAMDFFAMNVMGEVLRKTKAFFIRRSFSDDEFYRTIIERYVRVLLQNGASPIEFFIEGTRSRSSKSLTPKLGLLRTVVETFLSQDVPDVTVVPITICYDRLMEEQLFAYELMGVPKPKESTSGLVKALSILNQTYGSVHVNIGTPFTLRAFSFHHGLGPLATRDPKVELELTERLGLEILNRQRNLQVVTCINLLALVLSTEYLKSQKWSMRFDYCVYLIKIMEECLRELGVCVEMSDESTELALEDALDTHRDLFTCVDGYIELNFGLCQRTGESVFQDKTMRKAIPEILVQLYVNPLLHFLIGMSIVCFCMHTAPEVMEMSELEQLYTLMVHIFDSEFLLKKKMAFMSFSENLSAVCRQQVTATCDDNVYDLETEFGLTLRLLLYPFLSSYYFLLLKLLETREPRPTSDIVVGAKLQMEQCMNEGLLIHGYSFTKEVFTNALESFGKMGLISLVKENKTVICTVENVSHLEYILQTVGTSLIKGSVQSKL